MKPTKKKTAKKRNPMISFFSEWKIYEDFFDIPIKELGHTFQAASNKEDELTSMFNYIQIENKLTLINLNEFVNKCAIKYPNEIDRLVEKFDYLYS